MYTVQDFVLRERVFSAAMVIGRHSDLLPESSASFIPGMDLEISAAISYLHRDMSHVLKSSQTLDGLTRRAHKKYPTIERVLSTLSESPDGVYSVLTAFMQQDDDAAVVTAESLYLVPPGNIAIYRTFDNVSSLPLDTLTDLSSYVASMVEVPLPETENPIPLFSQMAQIHINRIAGSVA